MKVLIATRQKIGSCEVGDEILQPDEGAGVRDRPVLQAQQDAVDRTDSRRAPPGTASGSAIISQLKTLSRSSTTASDARRRAARAGTRRRSDAIVMCQAER